MENFKETMGRYHHPRPIHLVTTSKSVKTLGYIIRQEFCYGDTIGLTFIFNGVAYIATGTFCKVMEGVVVVKDLLLDGTTSYVPLIDVSSVEKGIILDESTEPKVVKLF